MRINRFFVIVLLIGILLNIGIIWFPIDTVNVTMNVNLELTSDVAGVYSVYYSENETFSDEKLENASYEEINKTEKLAYEINNQVNYLRIDFPDANAKVNLNNIIIKYGLTKITIANSEIEKAVTNNIYAVQAEEDGSISFETKDSDPYFIMDITDLNIAQTIQKAARELNLGKKVVICLILDIMILVLLKFKDKFAVLPLELYTNRKLIFKLAKNDFKTRFAGSYLGIVWAFIQPIVTVVVYWFVFQVGLRSGDVGDFPFVLWLIAGLVPWFFFSEALNSGTNALMEYNFLVKKVVFKISILPIIKIISAFFVHAFFLIFTLVLYSCYGYFPDIYSVQVLYYTFCMFMLVLGLSYATCSIVIFFRDLTQIINIILQVGVWMTPIMWQIDILPANLHFIFKLNPMFYVVNGYRNALIYKAWFWNDFYSTAYFWIITAALFGIGALTFKKLKVHFADIL